MSSARQKCFKSLPVEQKRCMNASEDFAEADDSTHVAEFPFRYVFRFAGIRRRISPCIRREFSSLKRFAPGVEAAKSFHTPPEVAGTSLKTRSATKSLAPWRAAKEGSGVGRQLDDILDSQCSPRGSVDRRASAAKKRHAQPDLTYLWHTVHKVTS